MAPPTPVYSKSEIHTLYKKYLDNPSKYNCKLKSITQHECTFKLNPKDRSQPPEIICLPFKRLFQKCLLKATVKEDGKKKKIDKWISIEVTDSLTNRDVEEESSKYGKVVKDFLDADKDLRRILESEAGNS